MLDFCSLVFALVQRAYFLAFSNEISPDLRGLNASLSHVLFASLLQTFCGSPMN